MVVHHGRIHCIMAEFIASSMQWHCIMAEFIASWMQWRAEGDHESCGRQINKYTFIVDIFRCASVQCISIHFGWILERRLSINRFADKVLPLCIESKCVSLLWCTLGLLNWVMEPLIWDIIWSTVMYSFILSPDQALFLCMFNQNMKSISGDLCLTFRINMFRRKKNLCFFTGMHLQTWLILPVVICLFQRLSHACLTICSCTAKLRMAHYNSYSLFDGHSLHG